MTLDGQKSGKGFTLVELIVVMGVILVLAALVYPAVTSLSTSGKVNQTIAEVSTTLGYARQYAVGQNTYVWVLFHTGTTNGLDMLSVAVVASKDGTDPGAGSPGASPSANPVNYGPVTSETLGLVGKIRSYPQIRLQEAGEFTQIPLLPPHSPPISKPANSLSSSKTFSIKIPGESGVSIFDRSIHFTPSGEARTSTGGPIDVIEFGLQPARTINNPDARNIAVFRVNGLTGLTVVYRP